MSESKIVGGEYDQRGEWERQPQAKASVEVSVSDEFVELVEWQRQKEKEAEAAKAAKRLEQARQRREKARQRRQQAAKRREQAEEAKSTADTTDDRFRRQAEVATWLLGECVKYKRRAEEAERLLRAHGIID